MPISYTPKSKVFKIAVHTKKECSFCGNPGVTHILVKSPIADKYICQVCVSDAKKLFNEGK